ncbi:MAG: hypothetical protein F6K35_00505 [Okeania sp. SIO2H7]|nr:hypothetical protein [Okeania sp. SIO2H7]
MTELNVHVGKITVDLTELNVHVDKITVDLTELNVHFGKITVDLTELNVHVDKWEFCKVRIAHPTGKVGLRFTPPNLQTLKLIYPPKSPFERGTLRWFYSPKFPFERGEKNSIFKVRIAHPTGKVGLRFTPPNLQFFS